ncbi:MAG: hypothetical protein AB9834_05865 [Lentimicrobium sp.]
MKLRLTLFYHSIIPFYVTLSVVEGPSFHHSTIPSFHHSNIPTFHHSIIPSFHNVKMTFQNRIAFALLLLILVLPAYARCQQEERNYIGVSFGGSFFHLKDEVASPMIFRKPGIAPQLQYFRRGEKSIHYAEASYYHQNLETDQDNFTVRNHSGRIRYAYMHSMLNAGAFNDQLKVYLGGSFHSFFNRSDYDYLRGNSTARAITTWYWSHSLDLSAQLDYLISNRQFITGQLFIPVVSNVSRPTYSPSGDYNYTTNQRNIKTFGETVFSPQNFSVNASLRYQRPIGTKVSLQLNYEFCFTRYNEPREIAMYMNNFRIGLFYCF